jgi:hypothetical protein
MKLHPFDECVAAATKLIEQGADVYQQFNCNNCGAKQTMAIPNAFYIEGQCEECNAITNIKKLGCNYMVHFKIVS